MSEDHDDFAFEPVPGLPDRLPEGESLLWQGSPDWRALAVSALHVRKIAAYFAVILAWQTISASADGAAAASMAVSALKLSAVAGASIAILCVLAWLYARGTIYSLTTKRIVIRSGLALPITLNLPLAMIETVSVTRTKTGNASIALSVVKPNRVAYLALWPNARPLHINDPQPMLRCLRQGDAVASILAKALRSEAGLTSTHAPPRMGVSQPETSSIPAGHAAGRSSGHPVAA